MKIVNRDVELVDKLPYNYLLHIVEKAARNCYQSQSKSQDVEPFIKSLIKSGHLSPIEFAEIVFKVTCDRGTSHQLVRHRLMSVSQASTRYCNYSKEQFGNEISVIVPCGIDNSTYSIWRASCLAAEAAYFTLLDYKVKPEVARSVLPHSTATTLYVKMNMREVRHFLKLRLDKHAQADIRDIAHKLLDILHSEYPIFVEDIWGDAI